MSKIFKNVLNWFANVERRDIDRYLASSQDINEAEAKMRNLERRRSFF